MGSIMASPTYADAKYNVEELLKKAKEEHDTGLIWKLMGLMGRKCIISINLTLVFHCTMAEYYCKCCKCNAMHKHY